MQIMLVRFASLKYCYEQLAQLDNFELFLIKVSSCNDSDVDLALVDLIGEKRRDLCRTRQALSSVDTKTEYLCSTLYYTKLILPNKGGQREFDFIT